MTSSPEERIDMTVRVGAWLVFVVIALFVIVFRLQITTDLSYFLPHASSENERVLVERLGQGPGSRLIFIRISQALPEDLVGSSDRMKSRLLETGLFFRVNNGQEEYEIASMPPVIWNNRYLLSDASFSPDGLAAVLQERIADLAVLSDEQTTDLFAADPHLASVLILDALAWSGKASNSKWIDVDASSAYLVAETSAPAFDIGAQHEAIDAIQKIADSEDLETELHGVGIYSAELQKMVKEEARNRTALATIAIVIILLLAYRNWRAVLIAGIPLILGGLAGMTALAAIFGKVHGITLAFGFTLFGVGVDYPLHILSHMRTDADPAKAKLIWPTMRLGALSTVIAYLAIAGSGSLGLAQLGCFSAIGILVTVGATRSLLPGMIERYWIPAPRFGKAPANRPTLRHQIWLIGLLVSAGLFLAAPEQIWNNNLASLTPLSPDRLSRDRELRMAFGAPDIRHLLVLRNRDQQKVLRETEEIQAFLNDLIGQGILGDSQSVTDLLPSRLTQESRIQRLRDATDLQVRLAKALQGTPFKPDAFAPFLADAHRMAATSKWVEIEDFSGTLFEQLIAQHLYFDGQSWVSLVTLYGLNEPRLLEDRLGEDLPGKTLVDLKIASQSLVENYRLRIMNVLAIAFIFITALLIWRIGIVERTFWILGTLVTSIFLTIGIIHNILGPLSLFTLIATVLVAGLGLDYGLFMSRQEESYENLRDTRHAVMTCALSTLAAFSVLALSDIPVLKSIGMTVAIGVLISITLARAGIGAKHS